jgi:hypothetical protein
MVPLRAFVVTLMNLRLPFLTMGWDYVSVELRPLRVALSISQMIHGWIWSSGGMTLTLRKTCPSFTLSTTNSICTALGANPGLRGEKQATNRLYYGTVFVVIATGLVLITWITITCTRTTDMLRSPCVTWRVSLWGRSHCKHFGSTRLINKKEHTSLPVERLASLEMTKRSRAATFIAMAPVRFLCSARFM